LNKPRLRRGQWLTRRPSGEGASRGRAWGNGRFVWIWRGWMSVIRCEAAGLFIRGRFLATSRGGISLRNFRGVVRGMERGPHNQGRAESNRITVDQTVSGGIRGLMGVGSPWQKPESTSCRIIGQLGPLRRRLGLVFEFTCPKPLSCETRRRNSLYAR
jgi:hypothetical protein